MPIDRGIALLLEAEGLGDFNELDVLAATPPAITIGEQLEKPDAQISILQAGGDPPDRILGRWPEYDVITRDVDRVTCQERAEAVHLALHDHQGALDGELVGLIQAQSEPVHLGRDGTGIATGRWQFTQTFRVTARGAAPKGQRV